MNHLHIRVTDCSREGHSFAEPFHVIITPSRTVPIITHLRLQVIHHRFLNSVDEELINYDETGYFRIPAAGVFS